jgi:hypothetical protein
MISINFETFVSGKYDSRGELHQLYVVCDATQVYYVGIARNGAWDRWFGSLGRMRQDATGKWHGEDAVSHEIISHMPESLNYTIDLYTIDNCRTFITIRGIALDPSCDLLDIESIMIDLLRPCLNVAENRHSRDPHPDQIHEREEAQMRAVKAAFGESTDD